MNQTLVLTRRLRWNLVLPTILHWLQNMMMFWRRVPRAHWDWTTIVFLAILLSILLWCFYRLFTGHAGTLIGFLLALIGGNLYDNALPIFARVRIEGNKITRGKVFTESESLENVKHYQTSREDQPAHAVRFALFKDDFTCCIPFVVDEEDCERLVEFLQARGISDMNAYIEQLSLEEMEEKVRELEASIGSNGSKLPFSARLHKP